MKKNFLSSLIPVIWILTLLCGTTVSKGEKLTSAQITEIIKTANLKIDQEIRPAKVKDTVEGNRILQTGIKSLAELEFNDKTLARLGSNTVFSFSPQSRDFKFEKGTILFQVPKGKGNTNISTPLASCAITGTTVELYYILGKAIYMVLEGTMEVTTPLGEFFKVEAGQALILDSKAKPQLHGVDVSLILETSNLISGFSRNLPSRDLIVEVSKTQNGYEFTTLDNVYDTTSDTDSRVSGQDIRRPTEPPVQQTIPEPPIEREIEPPSEFLN